MDRVTRYKTWVREFFEGVLEEMSTYTPEEGVRTEADLDDANGHYHIIEVGWSRGHRVHGILLHCDVRDGKIYVEHDGISAGIVDALVAKGVPPTDLVLGWHPPNLRHLTPFALT
jgi:hypothetical protein